MTKKRTDLKINPTIEIVSHAGVSISRNEDGFLVESNCIAVMDGATSIDKYKDKNGNTGAQIAVSIVKKSLQKSFLEPSFSLADMLQIANLEVRKAMKNAGVDLSCKENLWATSTIIIRMNDQKIEWASIGDCTGLCLKNDGTLAIFTTADQDNDLLVRSVGIRNRLSQTDYQQWLIEEGLRLRRSVNISYGDLNGEPEMSDFIQSGVLSISEVTSVFLMTDGFLLPSSNIGKHDWQSWVSGYNSGGLSAVLKQVRELENSDPDLVQFTRFKKHDDATAIAINF